MAELFISSHVHPTSSVRETDMAQIIEKPQRDERVNRAGRTQADGPTQNVQAVAETFRSAVQQSLKNQPMTTLGFAVVMGFILGALWKA